MSFFCKSVFYFSFFFAISTYADEQKSDPITVLTLVGSWELEDFKCEDGSDIPEDQPQNPFNNSDNKPVKTFKANSQFEDKVIIPFGRDITCETIGNGEYDVAGSFLKITLEGLTSPDCPNLVEGFNAHLEENNTLIYEFKLITPKQFLLLQPLENGETDFRCGKDLRVAEYWKKL